MVRLRNSASKVLWFDTETTGLDKEKNDIWQLAALIEIDGRVEEELNLKMRPVNFDAISERALQLQDGQTLTLEYLRSLPEAGPELARFKKTLAKHVDKFDRNDKFVPAGFNVAFDLGFLRSAFAKSGDRYFGSWFFNAACDVRDKVADLLKLGYRFDDLKLATVCGSFGIGIDAHDAVSDIRATRELYLRACREIALNRGEAA